MKLRRHRFLFSTLLMVLCLSLSSCTAAGFVPQSDTTWGELFRHFDSEEFSALDPQLQQMMDQAVLSQEVVQNPAQKVSSWDSVAPIYPSEDNEQAQQILENAIYSLAEGMLNESSALDPRLISFALFTYPTDEEDAISYSTQFSTFVECPGACVLIALQDNESGECIAFDCSDDVLYSPKEEYTSSQIVVDNDFEDLKPNHEYTIKARAFVLPPEGRTIDGTLYTEASLTTL